MSDYITKDDFQSGMSGLRAEMKSDMKAALDRVVETIITEMGIRFGEVNQRLDRMDTTLVQHGKQLAAGARAIAGFTDGTVKGK